MTGRRKKLPGTSRRDSQKIQQQVNVTQRYEGPLPHPDMLAKYDETCAGAADRIIGQFEEEARHRRDLEQRVVSGNVASQRAGQWMAFLIGLSAICFSAYLAHLGLTGWSIAVVIGSVGGLLSTFFVSRRRPPEE